MKHIERAQCYLSGIPRKILMHHEIENIPEFVLYELCSPECFNFKKAAYFVDNPDFDLVKGIVGVSRTEIDSACPWDHPDHFTNCMKSSGFNNKVRSTCKKSYIHTPKTDLEMAQELADELEIVQPYYFSWQGKNDNHGMFIYQKCDEAEQFSKDCVLNGICLMSFCPIY